MKVFNIIHPVFGCKIASHLYDHYDTNEQAQKIASKICGSFVKPNNKTGKFSVFYPVPSNVSTKY